MKKWIVLAIAISFLAFPVAALATMGTMGMKSKDVEGNFFGRIKVYPHYIGDVDFNSDNASDGTIIDESGTMSGFDQRNEVRFGWLGGGQDWTFKIVLEADLIPEQATVDRGPARGVGTSNGANFGVEKLKMTYNFGSFAIEAGWDDKFLDVQSGGNLYGDDHPFIGFYGKLSPQFSWEALYIAVNESIWAPVGTNDSDIGDWRVYTLKGIYKMENGFAISPFYAYSDNGNGTTTVCARVSYLGAEAYGKLGMFTPRLEFVYATGDTGKNAAGKDYDISAWAAYGSVEIAVSPRFVPFFGINYQSGDGDGTDGDIEAFNGITNISRYTPTFGLENAIIYRWVPNLGSILYANNFANLGTAGSGYGEGFNTGTGDGPGMIMYGLGFKGKVNKWSYKAQVMYFQLDDTGGLEDFYGRNIDESMGTEYDFWFRYQFNKHFSIGNCFAVFDPGDAVEDINGAGFDDTAVMDTVELIWAW